MFVCLVLNARFDLQLQDEDAASESSNPEAQLTAALAHRRICLRYVTDGWARLNMDSASLARLKSADNRQGRGSRGNSSAHGGTMASAAAVAAASANQPLPSPLRQDARHGNKIAVPFLEPAQIQRQQQQQLQQQQHHKQPQQVQQQQQQQLQQQQQSQQPKQQRAEHIDADEQHDIQFKIAVTLRAAQ